MCPGVLFLLRLAQDYSKLSSDKYCIADRKGYINSIKVIKGKKYNMPRHMFKHYVISKH